MIDTKNNTFIEIDHEYAELISYCFIYLIMTNIYLPDSSSNANLVREATASHLVLHDADERLVLRPFRTSESCKEM